jgi:7,8-dihydroneopterin aldolase/epimerase/oxygenase
MWNGSRSYQRIALREVALEVRLGAYEKERHAPQPVIVDVELYRSMGAFPMGAGLEDCLDYDRIFRHLTQDWPQRPHTDLIERLAEDLVLFCLEDPRVEACRVVIRKPAIYGGSAIPEIELWRLREEHDPAVR